MSEMKHRPFPQLPYPLKIMGALICMVVLGGCTETRLVAHMVKQVPLDSSQRMAGKFKVGTPYTIKGRTYYPKETYRFTQTGIASWYGPNFHGKPTANGERFDKFELTAAHKTLQIPSIVQVTNLENGRSLIVRVNDRGPFAHDRVIDLSERSAELLGFKNQGTARVRLDVLGRESRKVASIAKQGRSTRGYEVALNSRKPPIQSAKRPATAGNKTKLVSARQTQGRGGAAGPAAVDKTRYQQDRNNGVYRAAYRPARGNKPTYKKASYKHGAAHAASNASQAASAGGNKLFIQTASFSRVGNARNFADRLRHLGAVDIKPARIGRTTFYRVRLGPFKSAHNADRLLERAIGYGYDDAMIVVD